MSDETTILFYHQIRKHLAGLFLSLARKRKDNTAPGAQFSANDFFVSWAQHKNTGITQS